MVLASMTMAKPYDPVSPGVSANGVSAATQPVHLTKRFLTKYAAKKILKSILSKKGKRYMKKHGFSKTDILKKLWRMLRKSRKARKPKPDSVPLFK